MKPAPPVNKIFMIVSVLLDRNPFLDRILVKINLLQIESRTDVTASNPADTQMIINKDKGGSEIIDFGPQNKQNNQWTSGRVIYTPDISDIESISIGSGLIAYMYYTVQMTEYESVNSYDV